MSIFFTEQFQLDVNYFDGNLVGRRKPTLRVLRRPPWGRIEGFDDGHNETRDKVREGGRDYARFAYFL